MHHGEDAETFASRSLLSRARSSSLTHEKQQVACEKNSNDVLRVRIDERTVLEHGTGVLVRLDVVRNGDVDVNLRRCRRLLDEAHCLPVSDDHDHERQQRSRSRRQATTMDHGDCVASAIHDDAAQHNAT